ncbi:MAG: class I SAM-dependent methyltransferase [Acidimicrobiales bacterium]
MTYGRLAPGSPRRRVLALYRGAALPVRAHTALRWATCPFPAVAAPLPTAGRILEVGCGHGLLALYLALCSPARTVVGIDVDVDKLSAATAAAAGAGLDATFEVAAGAELPAGPWAGIAIVDVLYLLPAADQVALLRRCAELVDPGGTLVVKEMALAPRWKATWNRAQETASVKLLGITEGEELTFLAPAEMAAAMAAGGVAVRDRPIHRGYPHPHHLLVGTRPG